MINDYNFKNKEITDIKIEFFGWIEKAKDIKFYLNIEIPDKIF